MLSLEHRAQTAAFESGHVLNALSSASDSYYADRCALFLPKFRFTADLRILERWLFNDGKQDLRR